MRVVVIGAAGRLGGKLMSMLPATYEAIGADIGGDGVAQLDVTDFAATRAFIAEQKPDIVIHTAAWTDVDGCAKEPEKALVINGYGTQNVAIATAACEAAMLYVSTNEVFDGTANRPYYEYDRTHPINPYGYSKVVGERALMSLNPRHYIVRTSWLFAHGGRNFLQAILGAAQAGKSLRVVTNEIANPTYTDDLAEAIVKLIQTERYGIYHLVNEGACSRWDFARYALDKAGFKNTPIARISTHEWPRPSVPPAYTSLANIAGAAQGIQLRPWQQAVEAFLEREGLLVS